MAFWSRAVHYTQKVPYIVRLKFHCYIWNESYRLGCVPTSVDIKKKILFIHTINIPNIFFIFGKQTANITYNQLQQQINVMNTKKPSWKLAVLWFQMVFKSRVSKVKISLISCTSCYGWCLSRNSSRMFFD